MGYRSDGALWLSDEAFKQLSEELRHDLETNWNTSDEFDYVWTFEGWKWYSDYAEVREWIDFFELCDDDDLQYEFMRIGENYEDVECIGQNAYSKFGLSRMIKIYD